MLKIGLIGIGSIGSFIAGNLKDKIIWVYDKDEKKAKEKIIELKLKAKLVKKPQKNVNLVVEAASQTAVALLSQALRFSDVLLLSVGALQNEKLLKKIISKAKKHKHKIYISSGAIGGFDVIKSIKGEIEEIILETRKNPKAFGRKDKAETMLFEGNAETAVKKFPLNINVAATLSLAGLGFNKTKVRIVSDPSIKENIHKILVKSRVGNYEFIFRNKNFSENPKTSILAAKSALRRIKEIEDSLIIG